MFCLGIKTTRGHRFSSSVLQNIRLSRRVECHAKFAIFARAITILVLSCEFLMLYSTVEVVSVMSWELSLRFRVELVFRGLTRVWVG